MYSYAHLMKMVRFQSNDNQLSSTQVLVDEDSSWALDPIKNSSAGSHILSFDIYLYLDEMIPDTMAFGPCYTFVRSHVMQPRMVRVSARRGQDEVCDSF